ncbi:Protein of unknown function [Bacillus mycoides]|nr:Protein of unknown function [Bacillus mycoides]
MIEKEKGGFLVRVSVALE